MKKLNLRKEFQQKKIQLHTFDTVLGFLLIVVLFLSDVLQNQLLSNGVDWITGITPTITAKTVVLWYWTLVVIFLIMLTYMLKATLANKQGKALDTIMGSFGVLAVGVMFGTTMFMTKAGYDFSIPFFNWSATLITIYHFSGIAVMLVVSSYFSFTE